MTVSDDRLGLADSGRTFTPRPAAPLRASAPHSDVPLRDPARLPTVGLSDPARPPDVDLPDPVGLPDVGHGDPARSAVAGLGDPVAARDVRLRAPVAPRDARVRAPVAPPVDADDLPRYLRATAARADADDLATAHANCGVAIAAAARWKAPGALAAAYSLRTSVARRCGDLIAADRDGETTSGLLDGDPRSEAAVLLLARRIAIRLDMGDVGTAEEMLAGLDGALPDVSSVLALRYARGRLYACSDRPGESLADLFFCGERLAARGADRPNVLPWRSAAAAILVKIGSAEAATRLVAAEVELARRSGPASALGRALRIEGIVQPGLAGLEILAEAVRVLAPSPRRFEYAQALVDFGEVLNVARRRPEARRVLREALAMAEQCGSPALLARAASSHTLAGGKPPRP